MDVMVTIRRQKMTDDAYDSIPRRQDFTNPAMSSKRRNTHVAMLLKVSLHVCPVKIPVKRPRVGSLVHVECTRLLHRVKAS